jgi:hypothetical protein
MTRLRIATCSTLPEPDADAEPLAAALAAAGYDVQLVAWDDPQADWTAPIPTLIRSTWNYALAIDAYLAWIDRVAAVAPLVNPPDVVRANVYKRYLLELAGRGVPVVPTQLVGRGEPLVEPAARYVIKPEVSAGSLATRVFAAGDPEAHGHLELVTRTGFALVQPYVASVDGYGERSLVWIAGELSHAIKKTPRFSGDTERTEGPFPIADDEREVALAAIAAYAPRILYGRIDLARDDAGRPMVMELELVEPSLFFARGAGSAERFVAGLASYLAAPPAAPAP